MSGGEFSAEVVNAVLRRAQRRLWHPSRWTTLHMARTHEGHKTQPESVSATRFCAFGALRVEAFTLLAPADDPLERGRALRLAEQAAKRLCLVLLSMRAVVASTDARRCLMEWNDEVGRTHEEVLGVYARALKLIRRDVAPKAQSAACG